jgi:uncharacterized membrane-anchored protein YitT (DUF2179 family)
MSKQRLKRGFAFLQLVNNERVFSRRWLSSWAMITIGALIMAAGYVYFIVPFRIVPGGLYGIGIIAYYKLHLPVGLTGLVLNVPLILLSSRILGPRFGIKTIIGLVLTSGTIDLLTLHWGTRQLVDDPLLSSIFGGVLIGAGLGLIFRARATSGGTDIIAQLLNKYTRLPVGQLLMLVDAAIVCLALLVFADIKLGMYALLTIYVTGRVLDAFITGLGYEKAVLIISDKYDQLRELIINGLDRGGTCLSAQGMYSGEQRQVIFTALSRRDYVVLAEQVRQIDPHAFMTVLDANEIRGEGFKPHSDM